MLLRLQPRLLSRVFAELEKTPQFVAEISQRMQQATGILGFVLHEYIVSRYTLVARSLPIHIRFGRVNCW